MLIDSHNSWDSWSETWQNPFIACTQQSTIINIVLQFYHRSMLNARHKFQKSIKLFSAFYNMFFDQCKKNCQMFLLSVTHFTSKNRNIHVGDLKKTQKMRSCSARDDDDESTEFRVHATKRNEWKVFTFLQIRQATRLWKYENLFFFFVELLRFEITNKTLIYIYSPSSDDKHKSVTWAWERNIKVL